MTDQITLSNYLVVVNLSLARYNSSNKFG